MHSSGPAHLSDFFLKYKKWINNNINVLENKNQLGLIFEEREGIVIG